MDYRIEVFDTAGRRVARFDQAPLLEAVRATPDQPDRIRGLLPPGLAELGHGYRVRVLVEGRLFCEGRVVRLAPQWSDTRKLILDRYVTFHEALAFEAERPAMDANARPGRSYTHRPIDAIVKDAVNSAPGPVHYRIAHEAYPQGAEREHAKFLARKSPDNELEAGGIASGQWVGRDRMDLTGVYAKDGDTIAGLVVDGVAWPDLRLMMIDCEELSRNTHAIKRHPEVAGWSAARYERSGYRLAAEAARDALQGLLDAHGIDFVELNPHRDADGRYDDRVDAYGRYIGLVHGGGQCFNAALVEWDRADVYLYQDGRFHVPEMELKDFFSYTRPCGDSIEETPVVLAQFDAGLGLFETLTALAYAAGGHVWSLEPDGAIAFRRAARPDRVVFFDPAAHGVTLGSDSTGLVNTIYFAGNPLLGPVERTSCRVESLNEYGYRGRRLQHFGIATDADADRLVHGLLDDIAYPEPRGAILFRRGDAAVAVGDIFEARGGDLRRLERELPGEWGGRFAGRIAGRVRRVTHRFTGKRVSTLAEFASPLRSVENPLSFMVRNQGSETALYQFRLDDPGVGLDLGFHLD